MNTFLPKTGTKPEQVLPFAGTEQTKKVLLFAGTEIDEQTKKVLLFVGTEPKQAPNNRPIKLKTDRPIQTLPYLSLRSDRPSPSRSDKSNPICFDRPFLPTNFLSTFRPSESNKQRTSLIRRINVPLLPLYHGTTNQTNKPIERATNWMTWQLNE